MKNLLKNAKLRECSVNLNRLTISSKHIEAYLILFWHFSTFFIVRECIQNNVLYSTDSVEYREALFAKCKIRDCKVRLLCLSKEVIQEALRGKKCLAKPKQRSVRSTVSWIPTVQNHSAEMLSTFDAYRKQNSILPKNSKSMCFSKCVLSVFSVSLPMEQCLIIWLHGHYTNSFSRFFRWIYPKIKNWAC